MNDHGPREVPDPVRDAAEAEEILFDVDESRPDGEGASLARAAHDWSAQRAFDALSTVARQIAANLGFSSVVNDILDVALRATGAERGFILLGTPNDPKLVPAAARHIDGVDLEHLERTSMTLLRQVMNQEPVVTDDATADPRFRDVPSVHLHAIRSAICLPLETRGERTGVIYVDHPEVRFFPHHAQCFLTAFASLAAVAIDNARLHQDVLVENARLKRRLGTVDAFGRLVTGSEAMRVVLERAAMAAKVDMPVMILGGSGTGKELVARSVHEASARSVGPFVAYNCAATPRDLMESIFFGHARGAFTGAVRDARGLFEQAHGGVLFLDEIAELDGALQAKLLRVIDDAVVRPVGSAQEKTVDVRVISATSRDLRKAVVESQFREDLFYRLDVLEIEVPPLRDRAGDIPLLVAHFAEKHRSDDRAPVQFTNDALALLKTLPWPGNVRELQNAVQRAIALGGQPLIDRETLEPLLPTSSGAAPVVAPAVTGVTRLADRERDAIVGALRRAGGNKSKAARALGVHRNALARKMKRLGIVWTD